MGVEPSSRAGNRTGAGLIGVESSIDAGSEPGRRPTRGAVLRPREGPIESAGLGLGREPDVDAGPGVGERFSGVTGSGVGIKPSSAKLAGAAELCKGFWQQENGIVRVCQTKFSDRILLNL